MRAEIPSNPLARWTAQRIGAATAFFSPAELAAYQLQRLRETLYWARSRSPFYRRHLAEAPVEISSLEDLQRFPFTTAEHLQCNDPPLLCVSQDEISRIVTLNTSGTSGPSKRIFFTPDDQEATTDFFEQGMSVFTRPGDRVLILFPGERPGSVGDMLAAALQRMSAVPINGWPASALAENALKIDRERISVVAGAPVAMLALARHWERSATAPSPVRAVLLSSDHAAKCLVEDLQRIWGCEVFDHYGMTEMGLGGGVDCSAHLGYHMRESELLFEIIDPVSGEPVRIGEEGEVVFTTLTRKGMPLIRYRTGDISRVMPAECPCGCHLKRLAPLGGRLGTDVAIGLRGRLQMADLDKRLFTHRGVSDFSATLVRGKPDVLAIEIAPVDSKGCDHELMCSQLRSILIEDPSINQECVQGLLKLEIVVLNQPLCSHKSKRIIGCSHKKSEPD